MIFDNQTQNPLLCFGTPSRVHINGQEVPSQHIDKVVKIIGAFPRAIKALGVTKIDGVVKVKVYIYTNKDKASRFINKYNIDVDNYCTRNACMDCKFFNHQYLTEINRNCPLLQHKDAALDISYLEIVLTEVLRRV